MNERDFAYWLQGFFEMTESESLSSAQVKMIKEHLALVFDKQTGKIVSKGGNFFDVRDFPNLFDDDKLSRPDTPLPRVTC